MNVTTKPGWQARTGRLVLGLAAALLLAGTANALTLGQVAPPNLGNCSSCNIFQRKVAAGEPHYRVPAGNWTITSWSAQGGGTAAGQARLRVYRPAGTLGQFELVKQTILRSIPANGHPSFAANLDVQGGDLLGIETVSDVPAGYNTVLTGDKEAIVVCDPTGVGQLVGKGTTCKLVVSTSSLVNIRAVLVPR